MTNIRILTGHYVYTDNSEGVFTAFDQEPERHTTLSGFIDEMNSHPDGWSLSLTEDEFRESLAATGKAEFCGGHHAAYLAEII